MSPSSIGRSGQRSDLTATGQRRAREWRNMLGLGFRALGLDVTVRSSRFRADDFPSDFEAPELADVLITSTTASRGVIGMALDEVEALARAAGRAHGVVIQKRLDAPPERAYATMSVKTFALLMKERHELRASARQTLRAVASTPPGHR